MINKADVSTLVARLEAECAALEQDKPPHTQREELIIWSGVISEKKKQLDMAMRLALRQKAAPPTTTQVTQGMSHNMSQGGVSHSMSRGMSHGMSNMTLVDGMSSKLKGAISPSSDGILRGVSRELRQVSPQLTQLSPVSSHGGLGDARHADIHAVTHAVARDDTRRGSAGNMNIYFVADEAEDVLHHVAMQGHGDETCETIHQHATSEVIYSTSVVIQEATSEVIQAQHLDEHHIGTSEAGQHSESGLELPSAPKTHGGMHDVARKQATTDDLQSRATKYREIATDADIPSMRPSTTHRDVDIARPSTTHSDIDTGRPSTRPSRPGTNGSKASNALHESRTRQLVPQRIAQRRAQSIHDFSEYDVPVGAGLRAVSRSCTPTALQTARGLEFHAAAPLASEPLAWQAFHR